MNFLEFFFTGFAVGFSFFFGIWLIRYCIKYVKGLFDSPVWGDD